MTQPIKLLEVVALLEDMPEIGLERGQVGTVVELLVPGVHLVEFCDVRGQAYAIEPGEESRLMLLKHEPTTKSH